MAMLPVTPRGFRDVLPEEARLREGIIARVQRRCSLWGYAPIETPTLEVLQVLEQGGKLAHQPFRLFDADNELLVLRPDVTLPIARMVATRLEAALPLRLRYVQPVFREQEQLQAQARERTQIGVEALGLHGAAADAEVVLLLCEALAACGLRDFTVAICTVGVLRELLDACLRDSDLGEDWRNRVLRACHESNLVTLDGLVSDARLDARYAQALRKIVTLSGGGEAIAACQAIATPLGCADGLDELAASWEIIEAFAGGHVRVDFSVMSAFDYYTGLVLEAYAPGVGVALGSGGRYDGMLSAYGLDAPAVGFAFSLETVMQALVAQVGDDGQPQTPDLQTVEVVETDPVAAFRRAGELRAAGQRAVLQVADEGAAGAVTTGAGATAAPGAATATAATPDSATPAPAAPGATAAPATVTATAATPASAATAVPSTNFGTEVPECPKR
ncbi:MAG: ATP phosphoribosyltransferase regulatory subunit [Coriobacteriales bacterium]|nr:ATP phosphoribosyltransferase regulatory subunit [Coriobacteriales bacterium]